MKISGSTKEDKPIWGVAIFNNEVYLAHETDDDEENTDDQTDEEDDQNNEDEHDEVNEDEHDEEDMEEMFQMSEEEIGERGEQEEEEEEEEGEEEAEEVEEVEELIETENDIIDVEKFTVDVFDSKTLQFKRNQQQVHDLISFNDMVSCDKHQCLYIADSRNRVVYRVTNDNTITQWPLDDMPCGLSVNSAGNVIIVTCNEENKIKEFTTDGELIQEISLESDIVHPWHAVELTADQFVVCHGLFGDPLHRVCVVSSSGEVRRVVGKTRGSRRRFNVPVRLAVVNGMIFVADLNNHRIVLLTSSFKFIREVVSNLWFPLRIWFDERTSQLYVANNKRENGRYVGGQLKVFKA